MTVTEIAREVAGRPFAYGSADCVHFAAEVVERVRGVDYLGELPAYATVREARRLLVRYGGLEAAIAERLGEPLEELAQAVPGDVAVVAAPKPAAGVVTEDGIALHTREGFEIVPLEAARRVWRT